MNNKNSDAIKFIIFFVLIPFLLGFGIGTIKKMMEEKSKTVVVEKQVNEYYSQFTSIITEMGDEMEKDPSDRTVNSYILKSFDLYEDVYAYTVKNDLLYENEEQFKNAYKLMNSIYEWQMNHAEKIRKNFLTGTGMSEIYVLEAEQNKKLTDELTLKACKDVLKVDPDNQQAKETIDRLYSSK